MRTKNTPPLRRFRVYVAAAILGVIASGIALVFFALLMFLLRLPIERSDFFSLLAFGIGCIATAYFAGAAKRQGGLATGVKAAILFALPVAMLGLVFSGFAPSEVVAASETEGVNKALSAFAELMNKAVISVICGAVGGVLGVNKNGGFR
ncbi:MAG: hypothetical protein FWG45_01015 [Oscillospiraceae bacterium]|nr:hypothetical protein [Oscillospiraceae bacterium]